MTVAVRKNSRSTKSARRSTAARRRVPADRARVAVAHLVIPGLEQARAEAFAGERIGEFLDRAGWASRLGRRWQFRLPTICLVNGAPVLQRQWRRRRIKATDHVAFLSRPMGGRGSTGKMVFGIVAAIALAAFAPWAGGALASAYFAGSTIATSAITAAIAIGGSLLVSALVRPGAGGQNASESDQVKQLYSVSAQGNAPRPLEPIPVQYGRLKIYPDFAAAPWSEYIGNDQYLNLLYSRGAGVYAVHQVLNDDTIIHDETEGYNASFDGVTIEHYDPGETVTLFPTNVVSAIEVAGQLLPNPAGVGDGWIGGFIANASGTQTNALAVDLVFPAGCFLIHQESGLLGPRNVVITIEARPVDGAGTPTGSYAELFSGTLTFRSRNPIRHSIKVDVTAGRYEVRVRRGNAPLTGVNGADEVSWLGLRAFIVDAPVSFPVSTTAIRIKANAFTQESVRRFAVIQTRVLPIWDPESGPSGAWVDGPTRNPWWAFLDAAINTSYGARLALSKTDFQTIIANAAAAETAETSFDYQFKAAVPVPQAFDMILRPARARHRWAGDILTAVVDEFKSVPRMLLTDREIVRGSVRLDFAMNTEDAADSVVIEYVDEDTWRPAEVQYPPDAGEFTATNPARLRIDGLVNRDRANVEAAFYYLQAQHRRVRISLETELDGRALGFGSTVRVQTELPESWGESGAIIGRIGNVLTVDHALTWAESGQHYIAIRTKTGRQFGPVQCVAVEGDAAQVEIEETDLAVVEAAQSMTLGQALDRAAGAEEPSFDFGVGTRRARNCLVIQGRPSGDRVALSLVVNSAACYPGEIAAPPALPAAPALADQKAPIVAGLVAQFRQGVSEPIVDASWYPAPGAFFYRADVSYDEGAHWTPVYEGRENLLSALVDRAALRLRVQAIGVRRGAFSTVDLEAPTIVIAPGVVDPSSLGPELDARVRQIDQRITQDIADLRRRADDMAAAVNSHFASLNERLGRVRLGAGTQFEQNFARIAEVREALAVAEGTIAQLGVTLTTGYVTTGALSASEAATLATAQSNAASAIASAISALSSVYATPAQVATAKSEAISTAASDASAAIASAISALSSVYATPAQVATAKSEAISTAASDASAAIASAISGLSAVYETISGSDTKIAEASAEAVLLAVAEGDAALTSFIQSLLATTDDGSAEGKVRFVVSSTPDGAVASFAIQVRATVSDDDDAWKTSGLYIDVISTVEDGSFGRIRLEFDQLVLVDPDDPDDPVNIVIEGGFLKVENTVVPDLMIFDTPGTHEFEIPTFNTLRVRVYGAGAAGAGCNSLAAIQHGSAGGYSAFDDGGSFEVKANGGNPTTGTGNFYNNATNDPGTGGTASGGDTNTTGETGGHGGVGAGYGGANLGPDGGARKQPVASQNPAPSGNAYGGGGAGIYIYTDLGGFFGWRFAPGGGAGGFSERTWVSPAGPDATDLVDVVVGAGGAFANSTWDSGAGANGAVVIEWE